MITLNYPELVVLLWGYFFTGAAISAATMMYIIDRNK